MHLQFWSESLKGPFQKCREAPRTKKRIRKVAVCIGACVPFASITWIKFLGRMVLFPSLSAATLGSSPIVVFAIRIQVSSCCQGICQRWSVEVSREAGDYNVEAKDEKDKTTSDRGNFTFDFSRYVKGRIRRGGYRTSRTTRRRTWRNFAKLQLLAAFGDRKVMSIRQ